MRSISKNKKITSTDKLVVGRWYILYDGMGKKRILFKFSESIGNSVYDSLCYIYHYNIYNYNTNQICFIFGDDRYCMIASDDEVKKYFDK